MRFYSRKSEWRLLFSRSDCIFIPLEWNFTARNLECIIFCINIFYIMKHYYFINNKGIDKGSIDHKRDVSSYSANSGTNIRALLAMIIIYKRSIISIQRTCNSRDRNYLNDNCTLRHNFLSLSTYAVVPR